MLGLTLDFFVGEFSDRSILWFGYASVTDVGYNVA